LTNDKNRERQQVKRRS